ncbi:MAG: 50S ribosomal protein L35 [bacterium]|nr:50S ribosomal protein L35 [bacterium]
MPKFKTRKSVAKRFKVTKTGKVLRACAKRRHLAMAKTRKVKRKLRAGAQTTGTEAVNIKKMIPYV